MRQSFKTLLIASLITLGGLMALALVPASAATNNSCSDPYAIVCNGTNSPADLVKAARNNDELRQLYAQFGLKPADYNDFAQHGQHGTLYNDGTIKVDGKVVGHSTLNIARVHDSTFTQKVTVNGHNYWGGPFGSTYHANTADVLVYLKNGHMQFAVISSCGNPQRITTPSPPPAPQPMCDKLQKTPVAGQRNTYSFTTNANLDGASIVDVTYDFGDGKSAVTSSLSQPVKHTFTKSSTVQVHVRVRLPDGSTKVVTAVNCQTAVTFQKLTPPPTPQPVSNAFCSEFKTPELIDSARHLYRFTVVANTNNATFTAADFRFSDNPNAVLPAAPNGDNTAIITHTFATNNAYSVVATLHFTDTQGRQFTGSCSQQIAATPAPAATCTTDQSADGKGAEDAPCTLVNTGPGGTVAGLFAGITTLAAAGHYIIRRRLFGT